MRQVNGALPLVASEDLQPNRLVSITTDAELVYSDSTGSAIVGVTQTFCAEGDVASVRPVGISTGITVVETSGDVDAGVAIYAADDGKVAASGDVAVGYSTTSSGGGAGLIEAILL